MRIIFAILSSIVVVSLLGFSWYLLAVGVVYKQLDKKERKAYWLKVVLLLLVLVGGYWGRQFYIDYKHPYKDLDVIGSWDYSYSVTFDANEREVREDKGRFSMEMYTETEITLNDDGSFYIYIDGTTISGRWEPNENVTNIYHIIPDSRDMDGVIADNEIRWDKGEDKLSFGLKKDTASEELQDLFNDEETYRYIFCKTHRDNTKTVYTGNDNDDDYDEWNDDDNGLPFNYHP